MNTKRKTTHVMVTLAFALLMMATALVPMLSTEDSSAAYTENNPQEVTVHMRVGDTFTYTPSLNIDTGTKTYNMVSATPNDNEVTFTDNKLTAVYKTSGTKTVMLKAHWESGTVGGYENVTQDAYLKITMIIDERLNVKDSTTTKILIEGINNKTGGDVYTFAKNTQWTGPSGATGSNVTFAVYSSFDDATGQKDSLSDGNSKFTWDATNSKLKVGDTDLALGTYYVRLNISYSNSYSQPDTAYGILTVLVSSDLKYVDENGNDFDLTRNLVADVANTNHSDSWSVRTNLDSAIGTGDNDVKFTSRTITGVINKEAPAGVTIDGSPGTTAATPTFTFDASKITSISENYATYEYKIATEAEYGGNTLSDSATVTYHVYASAKFLNVPVVASTLFVTSTSDNPNDVTVTTTVSNADRITVYWGDGTSSKISTVDADNVSYTARHVYASEANYLISIVAENSNGNTSGTIYYDSANNLIDNTVKDIKSKSESIIDEHGWLFIVLIAVGAVLSVICLIWYPDNRLIALGVILIAVGAVIFFGGWKLP